MKLNINLEINIAKKKIIKSSALVKPKFSIVNTLTGSYKLGEEEVTPPINNENYRTNLNNTIALTANWRIFDAGRSQDLKKQNKSRKNIFKESLVGYTNAGKSSLMNSIALSDNYVKDELFATLDTSTKKINIS